MKGELTDVLFFSFGRSLAPWISSITIPMMSFAALKLKSLFFAIQDLRNFDFCCVTDGRGTAPGTVPGVTGVVAPELGTERAPVLLAAVVDPDTPEGVGLLTVVTESAESERAVLDLFGNMLGILNPGDVGLEACGVF